MTDRATTDRFGHTIARVRTELRDRCQHGMTQAQFAKRFGLTFGSLKDAEQGRVKASGALRVLVAAIELDPQFVDRAVALSQKLSLADRRNVRDAGD